MLLAKKHEELVLTLNHTMEEKASTTVYINETYTQIHLKRKEIELQKQHLKQIEEQLEKEREEFLKRKQKLNEEVSGMIHLKKKKTELYRISGRKFSRLTSVPCSTSYEQWDGNRSATQAHSSLLEYTLVVS